MAARAGGRTALPVLLLGMGLLAGCAGKPAAPVAPPPPPPPVEQKAEEPVIRATPDLSVGRRVARIVELLNANDERTARVELAELLRQAPDNREGKTLRESVEGNPRELLPRGSFSYVVQPGDTYITLALDYLQDSYKFYALARLNGIAPNMLKTGDVLQIPGRLRSPRRPGQPRPPVRPRAEPTETPVGTAPPPVATPRTDPARAQQLRRAGLERMSAGQIGQAVARLQQAQQFDPGNAAIAADLARAQRIQQAVKSRP